MDQTILSLCKSNVRIREIPKILFLCDIFQKESFMNHIQVYTNLYLKG